MPELQAFFANFTAATEAHGANSEHPEPGPQQHYLRSMQVLNPESLAIYSQRVGTDRANPYFQPGAFRALGNGGLQVFSNSVCANSAPSVSGPPNEDDLPEPDRTDHPVQSRQHAGNPQRGRGARLQPAGPVHVQRPDQPVPARHLRREMMSDERDRRISTTRPSST